MGHYANGTTPAAIVSANPSEEFRPEPIFIVSGWGRVSTNRRNFPVSHPLQSLHSIIIFAASQHSHSPSRQRFVDSVADGRIDCYRHAEDDRDSSWKMRASAY
jgi:hypothetical protein